jgi:hypothetical protein
VLGKPNSQTIRNGLSVAGLACLTLLVGLVYAVEPRSPRDLADRIALWLDANAHRPNLRAGERFMAAALRAETAGADSLADRLELSAAGAFRRASASAPGPREEMLANDRVADAYLALGRRHLERGRGNRFGLGRHAGELGMAEGAAACLVALAPTRRRGQINAFVEELEAVLERPLARGCLK